MHRSFSLVTLALVVVAALAVGSSGLMVHAQGSGEKSFGESAPVIPGYNAPYPALRAATRSGAVSGSWSATAPVIPGYNAAYPIFRAAARTGASSSAWSASAPVIPGYNAPYPLLGALTSTD